MLADSVVLLKRAALGGKSEFYSREIDPIPQPLTYRVWGIGVMSIANKTRRIAVQCAAVVVVALATNLLESAGAPDSAAVTQSTRITIVDRSRKGDRFIPATPLVKIVLPRGCESSVSSVTKLSRSNLLWRCVT
jgi:hypothetical protein